MDIEKKTATDDDDAAIAALAENLLWRFDARSVLVLALRDDADTLMGAASLKERAVMVDDLKEVRKLLDSMISEAER